MQNGRYLRLDNGREQTDYSTIELRDCLAVQPVGRCFDHIAMAGTRDTPAHQYSLGINGFERIQDSLITSLDTLP